jgi:hypothetical protein
MWRLHHGAALFLALAAFTLAVFQEVIRFQAFGAEFPLYWVYDHGISFGAVLASYGIFNQMWYRPTAATLIAWIGAQFFSWHDLAGWKLLALLSLVLTACALYWFVRVIVPGARVAAISAALYYLSHPAQDTLPLQMLPWDALYVMFGLLCAGFYWRALHTERRASWIETAKALAMFIAALTCKEMAVAIPGFLAVESCIALWGRVHWRTVRREVLRLAPFAAVLGLYLTARLASLRALAASGGNYRVSADWAAVLNNLRMLPLMSLRIFYLSGYRIEWRSYLETTLSNLVGAAILVVTIAGWVYLVRKRPELRQPGLLFLLWVAAFLLLPVYSGGSIWHVTMPLCGYGALFGLAVWGSLQPGASFSPLAYSGLAVAGAVLLIAGRASLNDELYHGLFTAPSLLTRDLLAHPPIPAEKLGPHPTIYMEDRLNLGGWCYGCYGNLMRYVYQRSDIAERVVRPGQLAQIKTPETYYTVYDSSYHWRDASAEMRGALQVTPAFLDLKFTEPMKFEVVEPVTWSTAPLLGSIDAEGWFQAPSLLTNQPPGRLAVAPEIASLAPAASVRFTAGTSSRTSVRLTAAAMADASRTGQAVIELNTVQPEAVRWSVDPADGGSITSNGVYTAPSGSGARTVTIRATDGKRATAATVTLGAPWQTMDIGNVLERGSYRREGDAVNVSGSGDIFLGTDAFRYVYQTLDGDGSITAEVSTPAETAFTKAGLMFRERLTDSARHAFAAVFSGKSCILEARPHPEAATPVEFGPNVAKWLRLVRIGDSFTGLYSRDGAQWAQIGPPVTVRMERRVFAGLAVSSGNRGLTTAQFRSVKVTSDGAPKN